MSRSVLLTAALEDSEQFRDQLEKEALDLLHYPLETYEPVEDDNEVLDALQLLDEFENIVHGNKRNAQYFLQKVKKYDKLDELQNRLNLAVDQPTADYLEEEGIAAVHPHSEGESIDLMEFMLRIKRFGQTLYPCGDKTAEDLPGFLQELDMPVEELVVFTLEGIEEMQLEEYRDELATHEPAVIVFHSRRSVTRMLAAFPSLITNDAHVISAAQGVTGKLETKDIEPDVQADGSWDSIREEVVAYFQ